MSDLEQNFIQATQHLHDASLQFAQLKLQVISNFMEVHHPDVKFEIKTVEDNLLSSEIVFPGLELMASRSLAEEIEIYLQTLLGRKGRRTKEVKVEPL